jgi:endonuclease VIII
VAEGDTILRAARRIERALGGEVVSVTAPDPRGRAASVEELDGRQLNAVETRGKHLLLDFGEIVLHSHLGMNGSWRLARGDDRALGRPASSAWVILRSGDRIAAQFGGPTLRVLSRRQILLDPVLSRLGPDVLAPDLDSEVAIGSLRKAPAKEIGDALLDQRLVAGIGNIFKSEACFAARIDPWRRIGELGDERLRGVVESARELMLAAVEGGRADRAVYRRAGRPCRVCGTPILSRGQGDANRTTYWCPNCQALPRDG